MILYWLRDIRNELGKSQEAVAEAAGIGQSGYSMIELGERRPSVETAKSIATELNFDWTRFYEGEPTPTNK